MQFANTDCFLLTHKLNIKNQKEFKRKCLRQNGPMSMALFSLAAICEMIADSSSHNIFPFEFIMYGFLTIPAIIGTISSQFIRGLVLKKKCKLTLTRLYSNVK
jgi:hypothetical protein